jgi:hypothetical protein
MIDDQTTQNCSRNLLKKKVENCRQNCRIAQMVLNCSNTTEIAQKLHFAINPVSADYILGV